MLQPDLRASIRAAVIVVASLAGLIWIALTVGSTPSDLFARRVPPRSYRHAPLAAVISDLERHAVIPLGTVWEDEAARRLPVTIDFWLFPTDREAVRAIAQRAGVVMAYPMDRHGGILGPIHIKEAAGLPGGVEPYKVNRWEGPIYASDRLPTPKK